MSVRYLDIIHPLQLRRGEVLLGHLDVDYVDQPLFICTFTPSATFESLRLLFDTDARLISNQNRNAADEEALRGVMEQIRCLDLRIIGLNGEADDFVLHIDGKRAWFSYWNFTSFRPRIVEQ